MTTLVQEKVQQAVQILRELKIDYLAHICARDQRGG